MTELGPNTSATTYWVAESDESHVVTTVDIVLERGDVADQHAVARFFRGAFPRPGAGDLRFLCPCEHQQVVRVRRLDDRIEIARMAGSSDF